MSWYWWLLIVLVAFGLGMVSVRYFQGTHPPDRRRAERRTGDRRAAGRHSLPAGMVDRRVGDRRSGVDRRKGKPAWQLATVVVAAAFLSIVGVVA